MLFRKWSLKATHFRYTCGKQDATAVTKYNFAHIVTFINFQSKIIPSPGTPVFSLVFFQTRLSIHNLEIPSIELD